ncbi:MAG: YjbE family putative metal transport protein [Geminicoccaceae bacterium]
MIEGEIGAWLTAFVSVVLIDIVLAGDNAVVVGAAASGLPSEQKRKVIFYGLAIAFACRVLFAVVAVQLLAIIGLLLAGGILLLWVSWKMYRDLSGQGGMHGEVDIHGLTGSGKTFRSALIQVAIADISMSLDNVLAVAGAARDHIWTLVFGLVLSIALMGVAASYIATYMERHRWLGYVGLLLVTWIAVRMIWEGGHEVMNAM